jgi:hypothetical protein
VALDSQSHHSSRIYYPAHPSIPSPSSSFTPPPPHPLSQVTALVTLPKRRSRFPCPDLLMYKPCDGLYTSHRAQESYHLYCIQIVTF